MRTFLVCGAAALMASGCASTPEPSPQMLALRAPAAGQLAPGFVQGGPAEFIASQQFILHSKHAEADYLIQVLLPLPPPIPENANKGIEIMKDLFPNRDAAAIYVTDGGSDFPAYVGHRDSQFIIGIQPFFKSWKELYDGRFRDFAHFPYPGAPTSGGGAKFEAFLKEELRPFIESRYPVDPKKAVLAGYSLGGLFALNVLANDPGSFSGYLIGDPSSGDAALGQRLRAGVSKANGERVYLGVADLNRPGVRPENDALVAILQAPNSKLVVRHQEFPGETHGSAPPFIVAKGLQWMFAPPLPPKPVN